MQIPTLRWKCSALAVVVGTALLAVAQPGYSRITRIVIDTKASPAFNGADLRQRRPPYETLAGRAFGELDPNDAHNTIINDIPLAPRNADGKVEYMATFFLVKPIDMTQEQRLLWQDVPNRGGRITIAALERNDGDVGLSSGWQADNSGATAQSPAPGNTNDYVGRAGARRMPTARRSPGR